MDYKEKYERILENYQLLKEENLRLRNQLKLESRNYWQNDSNYKRKQNHIDDISAVSMRSSAIEQIALFRSLFKGRNDVYARRWYSEKSGKSGYSPVCINEWDLNLCDKKNVKCNACQNRKYRELSNMAIEAHLRGEDKFGKDAVGFIPL